MKGLWPLIRWIVFIGWAVAAVRLASDFYAAAHPEFAAAEDPKRMFMSPELLGVYYVMPLVYLAAGIRRTFVGVRYVRFLLACLVIGVLVWGLPNLIAYGIAQFQGWSFGRFAEGRGPHHGATLGAKLFATVMVSAITALVGTVWTIAWGTVLAWLPSRRRAA